MLVHLALSRAWLPWSDGAPCGLRGRNLTETLSFEFLSFTTVAMLRSSFSRIAQAASRGLATAAPAAKEVRNLILITSLVTANHAEIKKSRE